MVMATTVRTFIDKIAGDIFVGISRHHLRRFLRHTTQTQAIQQQQLKEILKNSDNSDFGRKHNFAKINSTADYRQRVPIHEYETLRPWIEAVFAGNTQALFNDPAATRGFGFTSGTAAAPKIIPFTTSAIETYIRGWLLWGIEAFPAHPHAYSGKILALTGEDKQQLTNTKLPITNMASLTASKQMHLVRRRYIIPSWVNTISDTATRLYLTARIALENPDITFVTTANPSTLITLARLIRDEAPAMIRDIHDGTGPANVAGQQQRLRPNRQRAKILEQLANRGKLRPVDYWPNLALLAVWLGGTLSWYLPELEHWYPNIPKRDPGLIATEGRFTIPFADNDNSGVLAIESGYFEFLPSGTVGDQTLEAHELDVGGDYELIVTTHGGLFRYRMHDIVRCVSKLGDSPQLAFLRKDAGFWNFTGEKISAEQVAECLARLHREFRMPTTHLALAPVFAETPHYALLGESDTFVDVIPNDLARAFELHLKDVNIEYRDKRHSGRLGAVQFREITVGSWERWKAIWRQHSGASLEQVKPPILISDIKLLDKLLQS